VNWTANNTALGDYSANNLNTDVVEQVYRSSNLAVNLTCDTQLSQGSFVDTVAILNHNITTSGSITLLGSNVPTFSSVGISIAIPIVSSNIYWVSPQLPNESFRYWRFVINDVQNPQGYVQIGTIVFGSSVIFNEECFINPVVYGRVNFIDKIQTEGFTNISSDRGVKNYVELTYNNLSYGRGNYLSMVETFDYVRTTHKALWIPDPRYPNRYGIFGKLTELPQESHQDMGVDSDYVSFRIKIDESL
jgi:hypothetical protein